MRGEHWVIFRPKMGRKERKITDGATKNYFSVTQNSFIPFAGLCFVFTSISCT